MLDLVIVNYRTAAMTAECVRSFLEWTELDHTLTVVDNGSGDGSAEMLSRTFPQVRVLANPANLGYAKACNLGALAGQGDHLIFLNSDVLALPGWDRPLVACLEGDARIAVAGPKLVNAQNLIVGAGVVGTNAQPVIRGWQEPDRGQYDQPTDCLSVCGAAYAIKRRLIPVLGLFDERYFFYYEEADYSYHAREMGCRVVYCPASKLVHHHAQTARLVPAVTYSEQGRRLFAEKWRHLMDDPRRYG
jgi:hypothetical protein